MSYKTLEQQPSIGDSSWFKEARFGMFIHFGTYSLAARHEWHKNFAEMTNEEYNKYFENFAPDLFDPGVWADLAKEAGMKYFVITTKHHEGFCLWDSKYTDYKCTNTPYGKDILTPLVDAFRARGLKTGFYYSQVDWHHPDYLIDSYHPQRNNEQAIAENGKRNWENYVKYFHNQVEELVTGFGKVDLMWFDFTFPENDDSKFASKGKEEWHADEIIAKIRKHQPDILINDRLGVMQDLRTCEQVMMKSCFEHEGKPVIWESCQTFSGSWGYHRDEYTWKSTEMLVRMLIDTVSKGGNLILNVGPNARGEIDPRAVTRLKEIGQWMRLHGRSIYGCTQAPDDFKAPNDCRFTYNPETNRLYLHIYSWPFKKIAVEGLYGKIKYAQLLNDASEVVYTQIAPDEVENRPEKYTSIPGVTIFELPVQKPDVAVPVIEIILK